MEVGERREESAQHKSIAGRLESLDVFRGATIAAMMLVNNPGSGKAVYPPLRHAEWHGWTFTDLVFPFFLWIVGVAMTLSFARRTGRGEDRTRLLLHAVRRSTIIFALGLLLAAFPFFDLDTLRIPGVLQRIAVCYFVATLIFLHTGVRGQVGWTFVLLIVYWALIRFAPVPGYGAGVLEKEGNFAQYVDNLYLKGHMWVATKTWDPEGIVSTLPAIATTLFGILTGHMLRTRWSAGEKAAWLFVSGNVLIVAGLLLDSWLPINKNLWTSSFAIFMAGMAGSVFAFCFWIVDGKGFRKWTRPLAIYGMNAIAVYVLAGMLARTVGSIEVAGGTGPAITLKEYIFQAVFAPLASPVNASLLYAFCFVLILYAVAWFMYWRKWFIRI